MDFARSCSTLAALSVLLVTGAVGCAGDGATCGDGTELADGVCVPTADACSPGDYLDTQGRCRAVPGCPDGATFDVVVEACVGGGGSCGEGTVLEAGECVPDGSGCAPGTTFDPATRECLPPSGEDFCGGDTVWVESLGGCYSSEVLVGDCAEGAATVLASPVAKDTILTPGCYVAPSSVVVRARLVAEAGVRVVFAEDSELRIQQDGRFTTLGTETDPVELVGGSDEPGYWAGVVFENSVSGDNALTHTGIRNAGAAGSLGALVATHSFSGRVELSLVAVTLDAFGPGGGLFLNRNASVPALRDLALTNGEGTPVRTHANQRRFLDGDTVFTNNAIDHVEIVAPDVDEATTHIWEPLAVPTRLPDGLVVKQPLVIEGNNLLQFGEDTELRVTPGATLLTRGTAPLPIVLQGTVDVPGHWQGVVFVDTVSSDNVLEHVSIEDAGAAPSSACLRVESTFNGSTRITIRQVQIDDCAADGLFASPNSRFDELTGLFTTKTDGAPARMSVKNVHALDATSALFAGTVDKHVRVFGDRIDDGLPRVWNRLDAPYLVEERFALTDGVKLTVEAGTEIQFDENAGVRITDDDSALIAIGTDTDPISFVGDRPDPGYWHGLEFIASPSQDNRLEHVFIRYAGGTAPPLAALALDAPLFTTNIRLDSVAIEDSTWGVWIDAVNATVNLLECADVTLTNVAVPLSGNLTGTWTSVCGTP